MPTTQAFEEAYAKLDPIQKEAVDAVEGPVLVIAGPGTGKTHILTLRIANILRQTQAAPDSILALTFTDSAARTVSRRLANLIGEETARKVGVYTFHSFAGELMRAHPEAFPAQADYRLMGEVEQVLVWRDVLERRRDSLLRTPRSPYHYLGDLKSLEDSLSRERISLDAYRAWLDGEEKRIVADPELRYKRGGKGGAAGDLNPTGVKRLARLEKGREAADVIEAYRAEKEERGLYGYTDVLRFAADALATDEALRADIAEQYQYVLADEHQDANALQHALLDAFAFDDHPNLFVVGDEKQAIFGFQGADATHFKTFLERYPRTKVVTLATNYRSYQGVLDVAHTLLAELPSALGGHAALSAARGTGGRVHLLTAPDPLAERDQVATLVERALEEGVPPHEVAVITSKNAMADLFAVHLRARGIPVLRAGDIDLEGRPSVRFLLSFMHAVADPNDSAARREALLAPWWDAPLAARAALLRRARDTELADALAAAFPDISKILAALQEKAAAVPPLNAFSYLLQDSGARAYFLADASRLEEDVPLVRALMMHLEELARRAPNATFAEVMADFARAREHEIGSIKTSLTQREGFVTVITAHKAKGMEFQRVFAAALTSREWEGRGKSSLVPSPFDAAREKEEVVRLFYVAMTRAKDELTLSYAAFGSEGKEQAPLSLLPPGLPAIAVPADPLPLMHAAPDAPALVRELTLRYLAEDGLSPSAFNEYLESPPSFFAKRVLRLKEPENRAILVGNAVHAAAAAYLKAYGESEEDRAEAARAALARSFAGSLLPRGDTFDALVRHGYALLERAIASPSFANEAVAIEESFSVKRTVDGAEVVLKGTADAVFPAEGGECIIDFKTSREIGREEKEKFARQIAFYDLLLRANGHQTIAGRIIRIGEDEIEEHALSLDDAARRDLEETLEAVLRELVSGSWRTAEKDSPYDSLLKLFRGESAT